MLTRTETVCLTIGATVAVIAIAAAVAWGTVTYYRGQQQEINECVACAKWSPAECAEAMR